MEVVEDGQHPIALLKGKGSIDFKKNFAINVLYRGSLLLKFYEYVDLGS